MDFRQSDSEKINVSVKGDKLKEGKLHIVDGKVVWIINSKMNDKNVKLYNGEITFYTKNKKLDIEYSNLYDGWKFNDELGKFAAGKENIKYVGFYQNGKLPSGYTKEQLLALPNISVSNDNKINAYFDSNTGNVYVYSDNGISVLDISSMFSGYTSLKYVDFNNIDVSKVTSLSQIFQSCSSLEKFCFKSTFKSSIFLFLLFCTIYSITLLILCHYPFTNIVSCFSPAFKQCNFFVYHFCIRL